MFELDRETFQVPLGTQHTRTALRPKSFNVGVAAKQANLLRPMQINDVISLQAALLTCAGPREGLFVAVMSSYMT